MAPVATLHTVCRVVGTSNRSAFRLRIPDLPPEAHPSARHIRDLVFPKRVYLLGQLIEFLGVFRLVSLRHLFVELADIAVGLGLRLVATDQFDDLLHVRLGDRRSVRLLSLRTHTGTAAITKMAIINFPFMKASRNS